MKELDKTWSEMEFEHEDHSRTGLKLLKTSEELIETLEDNQVWEDIYLSVYKSIFLFAGSTSKLDDFQICRLLFRAGLLLAEETFQC